MRLFLLCLSVLSSLLLSGCLVVPIPHKRLHEVGVKGQIIDAQTHSPVAGAKVEDVVDPLKFTYSVIDGSFDLLPVYGMHGGYILAGVSGSVFPELDKPTLTRTIIVIAPGYRSVTLPLSTSDEKAPYILAGNIALKR